MEAFPRGRAKDGSKDEKPKGSKKGAPERKRAKVSVDDGSGGLFGIDAKR